MDFLELAEARYSVRKFGTEKVKQEDLDRILEAARYHLLQRICKDKDY